MFKVPKEHIILIGLALIFVGFLVWRNILREYIPPAASPSTALTPPEKYNPETLYAGADTDCKDFACWKTFFSNVTNIYGPRAGLELLGLFQARGRIERSVDDHQLAHEIGRKTAERFGINPEAFNLCATDFNYGCQHGYFEFVLGKTSTTKEAAHKICESTSSGRASKFNFYCYHGVGHGVMMARAYDLDVALGVCNTLDVGTHQEGCWQGVFMENANAGMRQEARQGIFSDTDPLAPCNAVEEKYQHQCFINHAGPLMVFFGNHIEKASRGCLDAPSRFIGVCLQSLGLMVTNPSWQNSIVPNVDGNFEEKAWHLCQKFPRDYRRECVIGAVDNIMNFDGLEITRAKSFCLEVAMGEMPDCYRTVGLNLSRQTLLENLIRERCNALGEDKLLCIQGAGISP